MQNFQKRHYNIIADMLKYRLQWQKPLDYPTICEIFSKMFEEDSPKFNKTTFKTACGLDFDEKTTI